MEKWIEIFSAGTWKDNAGRLRSYSNANLDSIVTAFDPAKREVPLVIGHPQPSHPAWGWVDSLKREGNLLFMKCKDVVPEFQEAVNTGRYRKTSIMVDPESFELEHVGFLGAVQPAVPGLANAAFSAPSEKAVLVEYSAWSMGGTIGRLFQGLRDHLVDTVGIDKANMVLSQWDIDTLKEWQANEVSSYAAPENPAAVAPATPVPSARESELETENAQLRTEVATRDAAVLQAENVAFCKQLTDEGRLLPAQREEAMRLLATLQAPELAAFSKAGVTAPGALLKAFLSSMNPQIGLGEFAKDGRQLRDASDAGALAEKASAFMKEQEGKGIIINAADAVNHIISQGVTR